MIQLVPAAFNVGTMQRVQISAAESEISDVFIAVADGAMPESELASWFAENAVPPE